MRAASLLASAGAVAAPVRAAASPAPPRVVAVINGARDTTAGAAAAAALRRALAARPGLTPLPAGGLARALAGPLPHPAAAAVLAAARAHLTAAREALARFDYRTARTELDQADAGATPLAASAPARALLADIEFERGLVTIAGGDRDGALAAFAIARRLAPDRGPLDPARYPPAVCAAWKQAAAAPAARVLIKITAAPGAAVVVDGKPVGSGNSTAKVAPGIHYVASDSPQYQPAGTRITVPTGGADTVALAEEPLDRPARAERLRRDIAAGAISMRLGVSRALAVTTADVAIAIRGRAGALQAAAFTGPQSRPRWRPLATAGAAAARDRRRVIADLLPVAPPPAPLDLQLTAHRAPAPRPWYLRGWGIATIGGGVVAIVVSVVAVSLDNDGTPTRDVQGIHF